MWPRAMPRLFVLLLHVQHQMLKALAATREMFAQLSLAPRRPMSTRSARPRLCVAGRHVVRMNAVMIGRPVALVLSVQPTCCGAPQMICALELLVTRVLGPVILLIVVDQAARGLHCVVMI